MLLHLTPSRPEGEHVFEMDHDPLVSGAVAGSRPATTDAATPTRRIQERRRALRWGQALANGFGSVSPWGWAWLVYLAALLLSSVGGTARRLLVFAAPRLAIIAVLALLCWSYRHLLWRWSHNRARTPSVLNDR